MKIKGVWTRLVNPTETADLNKGEHMDPRLLSGRPAWGLYRPLNIDVN